MKQIIVEQLNLQFKSDYDPIVLAKSETYIYLKCMFKKCEWSHWYNYDDKEGKITNIKWFRTIN